MGSRGAYEDVNKNNFTFKEGKQLYHAFAIFENVKMLTQASGAVKAPELSHTENRIYAIISDNRLKHLAFYDQNHKQAVCIDLQQAHKGVIPHKHIDLQHKNDPGIPITSNEQALINRIKRRYNLQ